MMTTTMLEQPLRDLSREVIDLRRAKNYDLKKLHVLLTVSKDSLTKTGLFQQQLLQQLHQFETTLKDINQILRSNIQERIALEQQLDEDDDDDLRAQLMLLNAEALECRAVAVQLQQKSRVILSKTMEIEQRVLDQLNTQTRETKTNPSRTEENHTGVLKKAEPSTKDELLFKESPSQRLLSPMKIYPTDEECHHWSTREFLHDDQSPPCILKMSAQSLSMPVEITHVPVVDTEYLLDDQEELIGTPLKVQFDSTINDRTFIILAIPYIVKRTSHHEHVIKIRQSNNLWLSVETTELHFDGHQVSGPFSVQDKRFVQCRLYAPSVCAVVSRLKRDRIAVDKHLSGRFSSSADARFTLQWPKNVAPTNFTLDARLQPVDLPLFTQFCRDFTDECQGLLAVGPIIELQFEEMSLLKPMQFTFPMLVPPKKTAQTLKSSTTDASNSQQQQSFFQSILTLESTHERLILLYTGLHDNTWHVDPDVHLVDSKTHDTISTEIQSLRSRMLVARYDQQLMSTKQLQTAIGLLEQTLDQRSVLLFLRQHDQNPREICLVCCSGESRELIETNLQQENYSIDLERPKEIILQEGQLLEIRFRGNVQPIDPQPHRAAFAFNTHFPFYFQTEIAEIDRYAQHLSTYFYGFLQIFSKQTVVRQMSKELVKSKHEWQESDLCLLELLLRLPKPSNEARAPIQKSLVTFTGEGILTPTLFRDLSTSLTGDEWRRLARRLGMTRIRIEAIEHDYHTDAPYYMLLTWFKRVSRASDKVLLLIHGLKTINRKDLAQDLQSIREDRRYEQQTVSKEEQLRVLNVAFNRICQREECLRIWKQLARELTLTNEDIHRIEDTYSSRQERCLRCLEHWGTNEPRADVLCLAKIIRSLGFKPLARELESLV